MPGTNQTVARDLSPIPAMLVLAFGTVVTHGFGLSLLPAMLVFVAADLDVGYGALGVTVAFGLVAYSAGAVSSGMILDRFDNRSVLVGSYVVSALGLAGAATANSLVGLAVAAGVMGFVAPVSWAVTIHVAGARIAAGRRAMVMSGAASGAALGVLINGVLVRTSSSLHTWRGSFVIAAALAVIPIVGALLVVRGEVAPPQRAVEDGQRRAYRRTLSAQPGRIVVAAGLAAGAAGFPFNAFLTATALDELHVGPLRAGALWWLIGGLGALAGPVFGRFGDRSSPLRALTIGAVAYGVGLIVLLGTWSYLGLVVAAIGFAAMNYPIWGLTGAIATKEFASSDAVRVVSLGLVGASLGGAIGNATAGWWIERTGSFRVPVLVLAIIMGALCLWYGRLLVARGRELAGTADKLAP